ncbi:MAG TPA: hypothetical protein LFW20_00635 [Rickettsia endosymbiont of Omalisus fontisbellaquei]|nr:hypothetical protein [Rickettsia endosymbiont of Omalisus fontisbellaquei]
MLASKNNKFRYIFLILLILAAITAFVEYCNNKITLNYNIFVISPLFVTTLWLYIFRDNINAQNWKSEIKVHALTCLTLIILGKFIFWFPAYFTAILVYSKGYENYLFVTLIFIFISIVIRRQKKNSNTENKINQFEKIIY